MAGIFSSDKKKKEEESRQGSSFGIFGTQKQNTPTTQPKQQTTSLKGAFGRDSISTGAGSNRLSNPAGRDTVSITGIANDFIKQNNMAYARGDLNRNSWATAYKAISDRLKSETNDKNKANHDALLKTMQAQGRKFFSEDTFPTFGSSPIRYERMTPEKYQGNTGTHPIGQRSDQNYLLNPQMMNDPASALKNPNTTWGKLYGIANQKAENEKKFLDNAYQIANGAPMSGWSDRDIRFNQNMWNKMSEDYQNRAEQWTLNHPSGENADPNVIIANAEADKRNEIMSRPDYEGYFTDQHMMEIEDAKNQALADAKEPKKMPAAWQNTGVFGTAGNMASYEMGRRDFQRKYVGNTLAEDWESRSQYKPATVTKDLTKLEASNPGTLAEQQASMWNKPEIMEEYQNIRHEAINGDQDAVYYLTHIREAGAQNDEYSEDPFVEQYMTDEERQQYNYLWGDGTEEERAAAQEFVDGLNVELWRRAWTAADEATRARLESMPGWALVLESGIMTGIGLIENQANAILAAEDVLSGRPINPWRMSNIATTTNEVTDTRIRDWADRNGLGDIGQNALSMIYQGAYSGIQSGLSIGFGGLTANALGMTGKVFNEATKYFSLGLMSSGAGSQTLQTELMQGVPQDRAILDAIAAGGIEFATEMIGMDNLFNGNWGGKGAFVTFLKQALAEGSEELVGDIASDAFGMIADIISNTNYSELNRQANAYILENGLAPDDRDKVMAQILTERLADYAVDFGVGSVSTFFGEGSIGMGQAYMNASTISSHVSPMQAESVWNYALENMPEDSVAYKRAAEVKDKFNTGAYLNDARGFAKDVRKMSRGVVYEVQSIENNEERKEAFDTMLGAFGMQYILTPDVQRSEPENVTGNDTISNDAVETASRAEQVAKDNQFVQNAVSLAIEAQANMTEPMQPDEVKRTIDSFVKGEGTPDLSKTGLGNDTIAELNNIAERRQMTEVMDDIVNEGNTIKPTAPESTETAPEVQAEGTPAEELASGAGRDTVTKQTESKPSYYNTLSEEGKRAYNQVMNEAKAVNMPESEAQTAFQMLYDAGTSQIPYLPTRGIRSLSEWTRNSVYGLGYQESLQEKEDVQNRGFAKTTSAAGVARTSVVNDAIKAGTVSNKTISVMDRIGKMMGVSVNLVPTMKNNGEYRVGGNTINIALDSWFLGKGRANTDAAVLGTFGHELTHRLQDVSADLYRQFSDQVAKLMGSRDFSAKVAHAMQRESNLTPMQAQAEVIANFVGMNMFEDATFADRLLDGITANTSEQRTALQGIRDFVQKVLSWIRGNRDTLKNAKQTEEIFQNLETSLTNLIEKSAATVEKEGIERTVDSANQIIENAGLGADVESGTVFSRRYSTGDENLANVDRNSLVTRIQEITQRPVDEIESFLLADEAAALSIKDTFLDFTGNPKENAIKSNSDYPQGTIDFNSLCTKRVGVTVMTNRLQSALPNDLFTADDYADIRLIMMNDGRVVACGLCYVEDRRQYIGEIAKDFVKEWNAALSEGRTLTRLNSSGKVKDVKIGADVAKRYGVKPGLVSVTLAKLTQENFANTDKWHELQKSNPYVAAAFEAFNNARGQSAARLFEERAEYKREILSWSQDKVDFVNGVGGLRIFSFSDFEVVHLVDLLQIIEDCAAMGVKIQGYTKQPKFARLTSKTGIKLNRSLIPYGKTGVKTVDGRRVLAFDTVEGIDPADPNFLNETNNPNVGNNITGINDEQIHLAMEDNFIHYIIPFHTNKNSSINYQLGVSSWENYKYYQTDQSAPSADAIRSVALATAKYKSQGMSDTEAYKKALKDNSQYKFSVIPDINIYTEVIPALTDITEKTFTEKYLEICRQRNIVPRFPQFLNVDEDGNYIYTPGYSKMLVDFKTFDYRTGEYLPQQNIAPEFDSEFIKAIIDEELKKDERERLGMDYPEDLYNDILNYIKVKHGHKGNQKNFNKYRDIVNETAARTNSDENGIKSPTLSPSTDVRNSARDADYMDAVNSGDMETAQRMVDEAAMSWGAHTEDGAPKVYYHSTNAEFTTFRIGHGILGDGIYFSPYEQSFYGKNKVKAYLKYDNAVKFRDVPIEGREINSAGIPMGILPDFFERFPEYDAIINRDDEINIKSPSQIKSADPVTYDDDGNVIPLSERFNTEKQDIRYSSREVDDIDSWLDALSVDDLIDDLRMSVDETPAKKTRRVDEVNKQLKKIGLQFTGTSTAAWTDERIDRYLSGSYYGADHSPNYAQAHITYMSPLDFLKLTAGSKTATLNRIIDESNEYGNVDFETLGNDQPIRLYIDKGRNGATVVGHEGRHRMMLLGKAGFNQVPVLLFDSSDKYSKQTLTDYTLNPQRFNDEDLVSKGRRVTLDEAIPFSQGNRDLIVEKFGSGNVNADVRYSTRDENAVNDYADIIARNQQREQARALLGNPASWRQSNVKLDTLGLRKKTVGMLDQFGDLISANQREKVVKDVAKLANDMLHGRETDLYDIEMRAANIASDVVFFSYGAEDAEARDAMMDDPAAEAAIDNITDYILANISGTQSYQARNLQKQIEQNKKLKDTLKTVREKRDTEIRRRIDAGKERQRAKQDSELRKSILKRGKRLEGMKMSDANKELKKQLIGGMNLDVTHLTDGQKNSITELLAWAAEQEQNSDFVMSESVRKQLSMVNQTYLDDIISKDDPDAINKLRLLNEALKELEHSIRTQNRLIDDADNRELREIAYDEDEILNNVNGTSEGWKRNLDKIFVQGTLSPMRFMHRLTGYAEKSGLYRLAKAIDEGGIKKLAYQSRAVQMFDKWMSDKKLVRSWAGKTADIKTYDYIAPDGKQAHLELTPGMRMTLYLASKDYGWMRHMCGVDTPDGHLDGRGITLPKMSSYKKGKISYSGAETYRITRSILNKIIADMSAEERAFADKANEFFNGMQKDALNATSQQLIGRDIALVDDYLPITVDDRFLGKDYGTIKMDGTVEGIGSLKERVESGAPVFVRDLTDILMQSIESTSSYVGLAVPITNFNKLMKAKLGAVDANGVFRTGETTLKNTIDAKWGDTALNYIDKMIADIQHPNYVREDLDKAFAKIRSNYARSVLTLNLSVGMKQAASYPTAAAVVGWKALSKAFVNYKHVDLDLIRKYTPLLWYRSRGFVNPELGTIKNGSVWDNLPKGLDWITGIDFLTTRKLWKAAEYYVQDAQPGLYKPGAGIRGQSNEYYEAVAEVYNRVIEETQPNYTPWQRPQYLRSHSGITQTLMMFKTQPMQNFNVLYDAIGNYRAKVREMKINGQSREVQQAYKEAGKKLRWAITSQIGQLVTFAAMTMLWNIFRRKKEKYTDEDGNFSLEVMFQNMGKDIGSGVFGMIPFGSDAWSFISSKLFGDKYYGFESVTDSVIGDLWDSVGTAWDTMSKLLTSGEPFDLTTYKSKIKSVGTAVAKLFGIPAENVFNIMTALYKRGRDMTEDRYMADLYAMAWDTNPENNKKDFVNIAYRAYNNGDMESYGELKDFYRDEWGWDEEDVINDNLRTLYAAQFGDSGLTPAYQNLYDLYKTDEDNFLFEYNKMEELGFSEDQLKKGIESCMKEEAGVDSVNDLEERFTTPEEEIRKEEELRPLHESKAWQDASEAERETLEDYADKYNNSDTKQWTVAREGVDAGALTFDEYMQFMLSLTNVDQPTKSGKYGSFTTDEVKAAIEEMGWTNEQARKLWQYLPKYNSNNPYETVQEEKTEPVLETIPEPEPEPEPEPASLSGSNLNAGDLKKIEKSEDVSTPESSWISNIHYNPNTQTLTVTTKGGRTYTHSGVSKETYEDFKNAPSKGRWYNAHF